VSRRGAGGLVDDNRRSSARMHFYVGLHQPSDARHFERSFISVNRLRLRGGSRHGRKSAFTAGDWIMDSGAFTTIAKHGGYPEPVEVYAAEIRRWAGRGLVAAVAQDFMCEPVMLKKTGLTIAQHQRLTIERYDALCACDVGGVYIMPVLQGYAPGDYVDHVAPCCWGSGAWSRRGENKILVKCGLIRISRHYEIMNGRNPNRCKERGAIV